MLASHSAPESAVPRPAGRREWWGLAVLILPTLLLALDMTVLHLAAPHLSADLQPTSSQLLWILDIYGFMIAGFLITMGTLGDRIGRRKLLLIGAAAFGVASVLAAFSTSANMLILTRALLGISGATLMPSTLSLIRELFEVPAERTFAITLWITGFLVGSAIGPLVGGALLEFFWWGSVFLLGVPVMLLLLIVGPLLLPECRDEKAGRLDIASAILCITTFLSLVYGIKELARDGISLGVCVAVAAGLLIGWIFIRRQRALAQPMFDLQLFANRGFSTSVGAMMLTILALSGSWLMIFQYLQGVLGLSPLWAGVMMVPSAMIQVLVSLLVPRMARHIKPSLLVSGGLLLAVVGFVCLMLVNGMATLWLLVLGSVIMGVGIMPMMILGTDLVVSSAPAEKTGAASATSETATELGMAMGIAVIGSIGTAVYRRQMADSIPVGVSVEQAEIAVDTIGGALGVIARLPAGPAAELLLAVQNAFSAALHTNAIIGALIMFGAALLTGRFLRHLPVLSAGHGADHGN